MATIDDVTLALGNVIQPIVYPNGINSPSIVNVDVAIFQGWPNAKLLDDFVVKNGNVMISIYPTQIERNTTRGLGNQWLDTTNDGTHGLSIKETKRQEKQIQVSFWCDTPEKRNVACGIVDAELAELSRYIADDVSYVNMTYAHSAYTDDLQNEGLYRGDLFYSVEYPSTIRRTEQVLQHVTFTLIDIDEVPIIPPIIEFSHLFDEVSGGTIFDEDSGADIVT